MGEIAVSILIEGCEIPVAYAAGLASGLWMDGRWLSSILTSWGIGRRTSRPRKNLVGVTCCRAVSSVGSEVSGCQSLATEAPLLRKGTAGILVGAEGRVVDGSTGPLERSRA